MLENGVGQCTHPTTPSTVFGPWLVESADAKPATVDRISKNHPRVSGATPFKRARLGSTPSLTGEPLVNQGIDMVCDKSHGREVPHFRLANDFDSSTFFLFPVHVRGFHTATRRQKGVPWDLAVEGPGMAPCLQGQDTNPREPQCGCARAGPSGAPACADLCALPGFVPPPPPTW